MRLPFHQLRRLSDCLGSIYHEAADEHPLEMILTAIDELLPVDGIAANELKGNGIRILRQRRLAARRPELMAPPEVIPRVAHDHPLIQHTFRHGVTPCLKLSDFVTARELREISLYSLSNQRHPWREQAAIVATVGGGALSITLNRDRVYTAEEFALFQLLQPHIQRILACSAHFVRLPGKEQLTTREREVLYWITQGKRDEEISRILACAERTVRQHTRAILRKLTVENRASAVSAILTGRAQATGAAIQ